MQKSVLDKLAIFNISLADIESYVLSAERGYNGFATVLSSKDKVYKVPLMSQGIKVLENIAENHNILRDSGLPVVKLEIICGVGVMDKIHHPTVVEYVNKCVADGNIEAILACVDKVYHDIIQSSQYSDELNIHFVDYGIGSEFKPVLKNGFTEILPQNAFYTGESIIYFDQESRENDIPVGYILCRFIRHLYYEVPSLHFYIPMEKFKRMYYCLDKTKWHVYSEISYKRYASEKDRFENDSVIGTLPGEIAIIGSGNWGMIFLDILEQYDRLNDVKIIMDNDRKKWKQHVLEIPIGGIRDNIEKFSQSNIIIAVKDYSGIVQQLEEMKLSLPNLYLLEFLGYRVKLERYII